MNKMNQKRLYKDPENEMFAGVCAGLADYFDMDVSLVRILFAVVTIFLSGAPVILYLVFMFVLPDKKDVIGEDRAVYEENEYDYDEEEFKL